MKKYLDILIFTLLFFLLFSFFVGKDSEEKLTGLHFSVNQNRFVVPAGIEFLVENRSWEKIEFESCEVLSLRREGARLDIPESLCESVELMSGEDFLYDFTPYFAQFQEPWSFIAEFELDDIRHIAQFEVRFRGTFGQIFIGLFYAPMFNLLAYFIQFFGNSLGWAIVAVTIIMRIILLFPQHKMMVSQRKLQAIQPKIKELQEKYKGKQQELWLELMKLYKKEQVNPLGSCGFLLIQMPIIIVLYQIIINITSIRNEFHLYSFMPEFHISQIDYNFFGIDLLAAWGITWLILALVIWGIQYIQIKLSFAKLPKPEKGLVLEKKEGQKDYNSLMPDPELMQKFMLYGLPLMVAIFTYIFIAWVAIYWGISTLFAIFQQLFVNKIIKK